MNNFFEIKHSVTGVILDYKRGNDVIDNDGTYSDSSAWQKVLNERIDELTKDNESLNKEDLKLIFSENTTHFVSNELKKALENLKDLNGNAVDFASLNEKQ